MYEQQTENLYSIIRELRENDLGGVATDVFTVEAIAAALMKVNSDSKQEVVLRSIIQRNPEQKEKNNELLKEHRKRMLQQKQQNQINVRRMNNADNLREKKSDKLMVKDYLDVDFDMIVEESPESKFVVSVNKTYRLDEPFISRQDEKILLRLRVSLALKKKSGTENEMGSPPESQNKKIMIACYKACNQRR